MDTVFTNPKEGATIIITPHDVDDYGVKLKPGQTCLVTIGRTEYPKVQFVADRDMANHIIDFLDKIARETA